MPNYYIIIPKDQRWGPNGLDVSTWPASWLVGPLWEGYAIVGEDTAMERHCLSLSSHSAASIYKTLISSHLSVSSYRKPEKVVFT